MNTQFRADYPIRLQTSVKATQQPARLRAVSTFAFARPVDDALDRITPPHHLHPLTFAALGRKGLRGDILARNSNMKTARVASARLTLPRGNRSRSRESGCHGALRVAPMAATSKSTSVVLGKFLSPLGI